MKLSTNWKKLTMGGALALLAVLLLTATPLFAQTATPSTTGGMNMTDMASPAAGVTASADQMTSMMEQCLAMMNTMMGMMGGSMTGSMATPGTGMSGMMGGGMSGTMATPGTEMPGMMATPTTVSGQ